MGEQEGFVTIKDIAKASGVSKATVGRVIGHYGIVSDETRRKVLDACQKLNYVPNFLAQGIRSKTTRIIAVVVGSIKNNFFAGIINAIEQIATQNQFNLIICNSQENVEKELMHLKSLFSRRIDGIIIAPAYTLDNHVRNENLSFYEGIIPVILIDRKVEHLHRTLVCSDNLNGSYQAIKYLLSLGHKHIGVIAPKNFITVNDRIAGYKKALSEAGIEFNPDNIETIDLEDENVIINAAINFLTRNKKITAITILNDTLISGVLRGLKKINITIPGDLSVISWDDNEITRLYEITTVNQQVKKIGELAIENILRLINNKEEEEWKTYSDIVLETNLIIRNSCSDITPASKDGCGA